MTAKHEDQVAGGREPDVTKEVGERSMACKSNPAAPRPRRILRLATVKERVGLSKSVIYERIRFGRFPKPVPLGGVVGWLESEIDEWIDARVGERDQAA